MNRNTRLVEAETVRVTNGIHRLKMAVSGLSVAQVVLALQDILNCRSNVESYLNGFRVPVFTVLQDGDHLTLMKARGKKGAIDREFEEVLTFAQAAKRLPALRGKAATNKGIHPITIWRWAKKGLVGPDGNKVRLEIVKIGGTNCTSSEALNRFFSRLQGEHCPSPTITPRALKRRTENADGQLRDFGF